MSIAKFYGGNQDDLHGAAQGKVRFSLSGQVFQTGGAYLCFCSMRRSGVFILPPGWDASPSQGYPQQAAFNLLVSINTPGCIEAPNHNAMSLAKVQTWTAR